MAVFILIFLEVFVLSFTLGFSQNLIKSKLVNLEEDENLVKVIYSPFFSDFSSHVAFYTVVANTPGEPDMYHVYYQGRRKGTYQEILEETFTFQDTSKLFFAYGQDDSLFYYLNGKNSKNFNSFDFESSGVQYSQFLVDKVDDRFLVINGQEFGPFEDAKLSKIASDKSKFPFFAYEKSDKWYAKIGGKEEGPYQSIAELVQSDDKFLFSYVKNDTMYLTGKGYSSLKAVKGDSLYNLFLSRNGELWSVAVDVGRDSYFIINGKSFGPYQKVCSKITINEACDKYIVAVRKNDEYYIILNGEEKGPFGCNPPVFMNKSGKTVAFLYTSEGLTAWWLNVNGRYYGSYAGGVTFSLASESDSFGFFAINSLNSAEIFYNNRKIFDGDPDKNFKISADGKSYGFTYFENGKRYLNINGKVEADFDRAICGSLSFTKNGDHWAIMVNRDGSDLIMIDGKEYDYSGFKVGFIGDNKNWGIELNDDNGNSKIIINSKEYDGNFFGFHFSNNEGSKGFYWLAKESDNILYSYQIKF